MVVIVSKVREGNMVYVVNGKVVEKRSVFRLSIFADIFWGIVNFIGLL